jgi:predicted nucleic acid-binding protein
VTAFVDSSMFYASADRGDSANVEAMAVLGSGESLVTSDHVLVETWLLLASRLGHHAAEAFLDNVRRGSVTVEFATGADLEAGWAIGGRFADQEFSLVDRTSFAIMERLGIHRAASLDSDFAVYRFGPKRDKAFEIVRPAA